MKSSKFQTVLQAVSIVIIIGIVLSCKLFTGMFLDMGRRFVTGQGLQESDTKTADAKEYWDIGPLRCTSGGLRCLRQQKGKLSKMLTNGLVSLTPPVSSEVWGHLLPVEKTMLRYKALEDHMTAGNSTTSSLEIIGRNESFRKGSNLTVMVTIRDGYGRPCQHGGDHIRVWMLNDELKASLSTEVQDLGNGSYIAVLPLTWSGKATVKASLVYNLAVQRAHYYVRYVIGSTRYLGAGFRTLFTNELTLCSPFRKILGYAEVCDFTEQNGGLPWFCGFPKDNTLNCQHWKLNYDLDFVKPLPSTKAEKHLWSVIKKNYDVKKLTSFPVEINILVADGSNDKKRKRPPCDTVPFENSWKTVAPRGHFFNETWIPTTCRLRYLTKQQVNHCLKNTTVLTLGDSNAMKLFHQFASKTECKIQKDDTSRQWHQPKVCKNNEVVIRWRSHAFPFHMGSRDAADRTNQKSVNQYIDEIPNEGRFLVIIHLYIHYTAHRDNVFITHIKAARASVEKLLRRNPNAKVVIRGPHTFQQFWFTPNGGDIVGPSYTRYIQNAFEGLKDRVLFLQPWDMTVAMENGDLHPPDYVTKAMVDTVLGHICRK